MKTYHSEAAQCERGAAATVVTVLLAFGVIFGFAALSVDVGALMFERRALQNGADAGALSLAQSCAEGDCFEDAADLPGLINANAFDGKHAVVEQCVMNYEGDTDLEPCPSLVDLTSESAPIYECPNLPPGLPDGVAYVEVRTESLSGEEGFVRNIFAGIRSEQNSTTTVAACARAAWGQGVPTTILPFTINLCEWENATSLGATYGDEIAIALNYKDKDYCYGDIGRDYDGGFGWLDHSLGECEVEPNEEDWVPGSQGMGKGTDCTHLIEAGTRILIPVNDCINKTEVLCDPMGTGPGTERYHIAGYAAFDVTGYKLPKESSLAGVSPTALAQCSSEFAAGGHCLFGSFAKAMTPDGEITTDPDEPDFGITVLKPAG